jgi:hypothetical protein
MCCDSQRLIKELSDKVERLEKEKQQLIEGTYFGNRIKRLEADLKCYQNRLRSSFLITTAEQHEIDKFLETHKDCNAIYTYSFTPSPFGILATIKCNRCNGKLTFRDS